jgi:hypothetical protein
MTTTPRGAYGVERERNRFVERAALSVSGTDLWSVERAALVRG